MTELLKQGTRGAHSRRPRDWHVATPAEQLRNINMPVFLAKLVSDLNPACFCEGHEHARALASQGSRGRHICRDATSP